MKQLYYHGTSADNLKSIKQNGITPYTESKLWSCSLQEIYLWDRKRVEEEEQDARELAFEAAQTAVCRSKDCRAIVFEIKLNPDDVSEDYSCENMTGAVVYQKPIKNEIVSAWISEDLSMFKAYFLSLTKNHDLLNFMLTPLEEIMVQAEWPYDDIFMYLREQIAWKDITHLFKFKT